ncbi:helix-turn-helix domain-containing protein [Endozoicomonadaceae bacterium StTr2]
MKDKYRRAKAAREMAGLSVQQAARRLGKSRSTVHAWEQRDGAGPRTHEDLVAMCRLYGITTDWYLEGNGPVFREQRPGHMEIDQDLQRIIGHAMGMSQKERQALAQLVEVMADKE